MRKVAFAQSDKSGCVPSDIVDLLICGLNQVKM